MISTLYIEEAVRDYPRVHEIMARFPNIPHVYCERYGEVFNKKAQNFRIQKQAPALILAKKHQKFVLPTPEGYGIGRQGNYYFSHMLNCLYDCRYCFLQGMYHSANYVLFVNYEDFAEDIRDADTSTDSCYFSGYDCDSLALEPVTGFAEYFLELFSQLPDSWLELRTKSTQIRSLLDRPALPNVIVAFSLSPQSIVTALEHKTPSLQKRLEAIRRLQEHGWPVGLRFDPLIYHQNFSDDYGNMFTKVFEVIDAENIHSVTLGTFRLPNAFFNKAAANYPDEPLFALDYEVINGMKGYTGEQSKQMLDVCIDKLLNAVPQNKIYLME